MIFRNVHSSNLIVKRNFAMRSLMLIALLLSMVGSVYARPGDKMLNRQYADLKRWHLGFSIGFGLQDLKFTHNGYVTPEGQQWFVETPAWAPGINVNVLADLRLHENFNLRFLPGMSFGFKDAVMRDYVTGETRRQDIKSVYVLLPIDLKVSGSRYYNSRPYVTVGAMGAFDVGKKGSEYLKFKSNDVYLTFGLGCDFYLPYFKFNPEIKFCFGLMDILQKRRPDLADDPEAMKITDSLSKVKSNMFMITFYFE